MKLRKGDTIKLTIQKMAYGGKGVGRKDGFVVFVRGGIPGDTVTAKIYRKKKGFAVGALLEVLDPSPDRVEARCQYSGYCGGCQWQHVAYGRQLGYKREQIRESMERIGGLKGIRVRDPIPSGRLFGYRNKMEFSFSDRRWFLPGDLHRREEEGKFALGLHVPGTYNKVIDVRACLLQEDRGNLILQEVKDYAKASGVPVYGLKTHEGYWRFLMIRYAREFDEWMVNIVTSEERPGVLEPLAHILTRKVGRIRTVVNNINRREASIAAGEHETVVFGRGFLRDRIGPFTFQISANSFFQTNPLAARDLYQQVAEYAELTGKEAVLDLYSGTGTIPILLARRAGTVTGIEISETAVRDARRNCQDNGIHNCNFICGDMTEMLSGISSRPDVLIIDPPRDGMHKHVLGQVTSMEPASIIYVSCNPATMARDVGQMATSYELVEIQPVDMFPHTYHIEAVAKLFRRKSS